MKWQAAATAKADKIKDILYLWRMGLPVSEKERVSWLAFANQFSLDAQHEEK